jgi:hypothetical protein
MMIAGVLLFCLAGTGCSSTGGMVVGGLFQWFGENAACKQQAGAPSNDRDWARDAGF